MTATIHPLRPTWRSRRAPWTGLGVVSLNVGSASNWQAVQQKVDTAFEAAMSTVASAVSSGDYAGAVSKAQALDTAGLGAQITLAGGFVPSAATVIASQLAALTASGATVDFAIGSLAAIGAIFNAYQAAINSAATTTPTGPGGIPMVQAANAGVLYGTIMNPAIAKYAQSGPLVVNFQTSVDSFPGGNLPPTGVYDSATSTALAGTMNAVSSGAVTNVPTPAQLAATVAGGVTVTAPSGTTSSGGAAASGGTATGGSTASGGATGTTTAGTGSGATPWVIGGLLLAAAGGTAVYVNSQRKKKR